MDKTKLLTILIASALCQTCRAGRIAFPESRQSSPASKDQSQAQARSLNVAPSASSRQEEFEGRSYRGGYSQSAGKRPDYSRYSVYEHEDDYARPSTTYYATSTTARPYTSIATTRQAYNRQPNAYFNRLPPAKNDDPIEAEDDYSDEEDVEEAPDPPSSPASSSAADYSSSSNGGYGGKPVEFNNIFYGLNDKFGGLNLGNLFGENRTKHKFKFKRRKPGQPCIPYDVFNRLRNGRDASGNRIEPKTLYPPLSLVLADVNYYSPQNHYNGHGGASDTGSGATFNNHYYDAVGGYPCVGVNFGHKPHRPFRPHGGPLGFFGQGGLFDWTTSNDAVQSDTGEDDGTTTGGTGTKPQVVFNLNDAIDTVATNWKPGQGFQSMMQVLAEFITSVAGGAPIAAGDVVGDAVDTVRKVNKEFTSLFTG
ncbi:uncharacterized protein LOC129757278 [Uranotaenia lowii]|uniref:uncharacterized protein LOC129757278 n=1 Tax=Uranotaenia lowii TaxID=190385 RepID=UPI0024799F94|nr:uncharacterized protein LOC129757278 [Uranotaenia lowii]